MKKILFLLFLSIPLLRAAAEDITSYIAIHVNYAHTRDTVSGQWVDWGEWEELGNQLPIEFDFTDRENRVLYFYPEDQEPEHYLLRYMEIKEVVPDEKHVYYFRAVKRPRNEVVDIEWTVSLTLREYCNLRIEFPDRAVWYTLLPEEIYKLMNEAE